MNKSYYINIKRVRNSMACFYENQAGTALIEFAVILPTLAILLAGLMNYGVAWYNWKKMHELVEAIVLYIQSPNGSNSLSNAQVIAGGAVINGASITSAILSANPDLTNAGTPSYKIRCGCPSAGSISFSQPSTLPPPFCPMPSSTTQTCAGGLFWGTYVTVTVQANHSSLFPAYFSNQNMSAEATIKIY